MSWIPKQVVVVPVDFSEESLAAVDVALDLAESPAAVHIVHILPDLVSVDPDDADWHQVRTEARLKQAENTLRERLPESRYGPLTLRVLIGDPGHTIANQAADLRAELIVMPSQGRTGLARMLIGSVAERVVRLASCPVLVLRK